MVDRPGFILRAGRTWRLNPRYRDRLAPSADETPPDPGATGVLDILAIEIDGVEVTAGLPESELFPMISDLARSAERLARGEQKATVALGAHGAQLLLIRDGANVNLSIIEFGPPPRVRLQDAEVTAREFFEAVQACLDQVVADLHEVNESLARGPFGAALQTTVRHLRDAGRAPALPRGESPVRLRPQTPRGDARSLTCGFEIFDDGDQLATYTGHPEGDLHALLAPGRVHVRAGETHLAEWVGPPFLAFQAAVTGLRDALVAWEAGEARLSFHFGEAELRLDTATATIAGPVGTSHGALPVLGVAVLQGALDFVAAVRARAPAQEENFWLQDLADEATELLARCRQFTEGDLVARGPAPVGTEPEERQTADHRALSSWKPRRLSLRLRWRFDAGPLLPGGLVPFGRRWLAIGEDGAFCLEAEDGRVSFRLESVDAAWGGPRRSDPVLVLRDGALELVPTSGATAWSTPTESARPGRLARYERGGGQLILVHNGRTVLALHESDGTRRWRFAPPDATRTWITGSSTGVVVVTDAGFAYGLDPIDGRVRWRHRLGLVPRSPALVSGDRAMILGEGASGPAVVVLDHATGQRRLADALPADEVGDPQSYGGALWIPSEVGGQAAVIRVGPRNGLVRRALEGLSGVPSLLCHKSGLVAADEAGYLGSYTRRGEARWTPRQPFAARPALALARQVLVGARGAVVALDPETGETLGSAAAPSLQGRPRLFVDRKLGIYLADEDGGVRAWGLGTHLSIVT